MTLWRRFCFWQKWVRAGCPRDLPVVVRQGRLMACPHGHGMITGWTWNMTHMTSVIHVEDLWDNYSARYPVERVDTLSGCTFCRVTVVP